MSNRLALLILAFALFAGCGDGTADPDASVPRDALVEEGGLLDANGPALDAALATDGGPSGDGGASLCTWTDCDPRTADGCDGTSCVLWGEAATCEAEPGALGRDAPCTRVGECAPGLACFLVNGSGQCGRICCPDDGSACVDGATCGGSGRLVDGTETSWGRCLARRSCDVHDPSGVCEDREGCYIVSPTGGTECRIAGTATAGEACTAQEDCEAGFFCGGVGVTKRCVQICRLDSPGDCAEGESCVAQVHTPTGSGLCSVDSTAFRR